MLQFFRKYQKIFFIFTTVIIVTSFAFFGTYQAFAPGAGRSDPVAFKTLGGKKVKKSYYTYLCHFLNHDSSAGLQGGNLFTMNFLNDGVIVREFLISGLAKELYGSLPEQVSQEIEKKSIRERNYTPYSHPQAKFLSAQGLWKMFAPQIPEKLRVLQNTELSGAKAFEARLDLLLAQSRFPPFALAQYLRYQEREYAPNAPDPRLAKGEIGLFGYRDLKDWLTMPFIEASAQVILHAADVALQRGYIVTPQEAKGELIYHCAKALEMVKGQAELPFQNGTELFHGYLRYNQVDEATFVKMWQDITLFRRLFQDVGQSALIDTLPLEEFYTYAGKSATVEVVSMPKPFHFQSNKELEPFEAYLKAVAAVSSDSLALPLSCDEIEVIERHAPSLVGKPFVLNVQATNKRTLQGNVTLNEMWAWEQDPKNQKALSTQFSELVSIDIDSADAKLRARIDTYARSQIVDAHPEWITESLLTAKEEEKRAFISREMPKSILPGVPNSDEFYSLIDREDELTAYTQDGMHFYNITVQERAVEQELLDFKTALKSGALKSLNGDASAVLATLQTRFPEAAKEDLYKYRFAQHLQTAQEDNPQAFLAQQFKTEKKLETISRGYPTVLSYEQAVSLPSEGDFELRVEAQAMFVRLVEQESLGQVPTDKLAAAQKLLGQEMRVHYLRTLLSEINQKQLFVFDAR